MSCSLAKDEGLMDQEKHIEAYLEGQLSEEENAAFEARLQSDPALREQFELHRDALLLLRLDRQNTYKQQIRRISANQSTQQSEPTVIRPLWSQRWGQLAAVIVLLIGFGWWLWPTSSGVVLEEEWLKPYPDRITTRAESDIDSLLLRGMFAYSSEDYEAAIVLLTNLYKTDPENGDILFYLAQAHMASGNYQTAVNLFREMPEEHRFAEAAEWYLSLSLIQHSQETEAREILQKISRQTTNAYRERAEKILEKY